MHDRTRARARVATLCLVPLLACGTAQSSTPEDEPAMEQEAMNALSREEAAEGFRLLFDGEGLEHWRGFQRDDVPAGWSATDGTLAFTPGVEGGDLITRETFADFDLRLEWKLEEGGNSGIFFGVSEDSRRTYHSGPEMQVLDDAGHVDGGDPRTSAGANYALHAPSEDVVRPAGEWNEARIVRQGSHVEHWLNGVKIVEYEIGSDAWKALVADSKFAEWPEYGTIHDGHIGLQDHGDRVWYRNLRIKRL
ncbi:MAG: DUF1080 domain-containing protein [Gemmatimonadota bacterium]|nr:DUF1080 domain-containing protein [Gemmatimonadota bacterium]